MSSASKAMSIRAWGASILCAAAMAGTAAGSTSASYPDANEIPDEKGRLPSEIAAENRRDQAIAQRLEARKARALEERRKAVSVPSDASECLAYHRSERRCLITVGEFNRQLGEDGRWVEGSGDSVLETRQILDIRTRLLTALLEERYADALVYGQGEDGIRADEAWRARLAGIVSAVGEDKLRVLYRKHAAVFGPRREVQAEFLGASDSSFLDSLVHCMLEPPRVGVVPNTEPGGNGCASGRLYQWGKLQPGDLPGEMPRITGKLGQGELSGIIRSRFGWYVIAAARVVDIPAKTFEESRPLLAFMVGLPEARAATGGRGNKPAAIPGPGAPGAEPARAEDPVLRVWLLPRSSSGKGKKPYLPAWSDTGLVDALRLRLSDLPAGVECEAAAHLRRSGQGISNTRFGTWYFRAEARLAAAKNGRDNLCDAEAEKPRPEADPLSSAQADLAAKEQDFKLNLQEEYRAAAETGRSGAVDVPSLMARWIAENVTLEERVLKRF